jgi:protein-S-isoprenylcysteine O-methyltransferase Ste14
MSSLIKPVEGVPTPKPVSSSEDSARAWARGRLERKRKFYGDLVAYIVINGFLIVVWAVSGFGYFWPGWVIGGWGVLLVLDAWSLYYRRPITEADIDRELQHHR